MTWLVGAVVALVACGVVALLGALTRSEPPRDRDCDCGARAVLWYQDGKPMCESCAIAADRAGWPP